MIRQPPLRATVPGLLGLLAICLTAIAVLHSERASNASIEAIMKRRVAALADFAALLTRSGVGEGRPEVTRSFFNGLATVPQFEMGLLLEGDGKVFFSSAPGPALPVGEIALRTSALAPMIERVRANDRRETEVVDSRTRVVAVVPVHLPGGTGPPWIVVTVSNLAGLKADERAANLWRAAWMGGLSLAVCLGVWWYFVKQVHRPLDRILSALGEISLGRFQARAVLRGAPEMVRLADAVNAMAQELDSRDRALLRARADLEDSEQCLAMALRASNQGVIQCDLDAGSLRISPWLAKRLGWPEAAASVPLAEWMARVHPADRAEVAAVFEGHRHGVLQSRTEHRIRSVSAAWEWVACESRLVLGDPGSRVAGSVQIVTERKESYLLLVAQSQILEFIASGRPLQETIEAILRLTESDSEGAMCSVLLADEHERLHPVGGGSVPAEVQRAVDGLPIGEGSGVCGTAAFRRRRVVVEDVLADPACAPFHALAAAHGIRACWSTPILRPDGKVMGTFAMYHREPHRPSARHEQIIRVATHLAAFAIQRSQDDAGLRASEPRFRYLADSAPVMIWMGDATGRTTFLSRPWLDFVGDSCPPGPGDEWRGRIHPEDRVMCESIWGHALVARRRFEMQYRLRRHDGEFRWLLSSGVPRIAPDGGFLGFIGCSIDVTGRRALEDHARHSQKMESIGRLAAGVAHDFNNILTVILGNAALLPNAGPAGVARAAGEISAAAERAAGLTRQLLLFSRQQPFQPRRVDLVALVRGFVGMMSRLVGEDIRVEYTPEGPLPAVDADPGLVEQVLLNLAANSRDAMPSGGAIRIASGLIELRDGPDLIKLRPGPYVRLTVEDTGTGIPQEILPRIFDPFFTTKEVGKGTGLGLATVYGVIDQHGGRIRVDSPAGRGARFEILLPVSLSPETAGEPEPQPGTLPSGNERILVVEDGPGLLRLVGSFLGRHGYRVTPVASGAEAMALWRAQGPVFDMLITDMVMPGGIGGFELGEVLRTEHPPLHVIYMSGYSREFAAGAGAGLSQGVDFLQKPYAMAELVRLVRTRLDRGRRSPSPA